MWTSGLLVEGLPGVSSRTGPTALWSPGGEPECYTSISRVIRVTSLILPRTLVMGDCSRNLNSHKTCMIRLWYLPHMRPAKAQACLRSLARAFAVRTHKVWK